MSEARVEFPAPRRFRILRHLASGGMGAVFEAIDQRSGAHVALKTLHASSPDALFHLKNEFRSLQDVAHPNLVNLLELVEESGRFFVVMELIDGVDFLAHVRPGWTLRPVLGMSETRRTESARLPQARSNAESPVSSGCSPPQDDALLRSALAQLSSGLSALHQSGKLHRDIKPSNILVTEAGRVVLVDFGLATAVSTRAGRGEGRGAGTRDFMAPEQAAGQSVTAAADWFSVGVVLYLALTGELPVQGSDVARRRLRGGFRPVRAIRPDAPEDLSALCGALLELDPAQRPTGGQVLASLGLGAPSLKSRCSALFVGRTEELEILAAATRASVAHAVSVFVVGDSGVGKSTLVREALERLAPPHALVLCGRCYERELLPYKALDGIVDTLSHFLLELEPTELKTLVPIHAAILARVFPVLGRVPGFSPAAPVSGEGLELRTRAFAALRALLANLARLRPVLLYIDDLQWADADSHILLSDLLSEPASPAVCLIATARPPIAGASDRIALLGERLGDVRRIALEPLTFEDAHRLAESVLGASVEGGVARAIAEESAGHPLFVVALSHYANEPRGMRLGSLRLDDALFGRVESLLPSARCLLEFLAVAGAPLESALAAELAAVDQETYAAASSALRSARLLRSTSEQGDERRIEPYHDRIRETILARLGAEQRRAYQARLAEVLEARGWADKDPQALVRHLEGAGKPERAAAQAELAAARALDALAFDHAAELFSTAVRLGNYAPERLRALNVRLAEALTNAGRGAQAARAYLACAEGGSGKDRLLYRRLAADHLLRSGHLEQGLKVLSDVLLELGERFPSRRGAIASLLAERVRSRLRGLHWTERAAEDVPSAVLQRIDAYHAIGVSLSLIDPLRGAVFQARAARLALDAGEPLRLAAVLMLEACYQGVVDAQSRQRALPLLNEATRIAERLADPYSTAIAAMLPGQLETQAGDFARAAARLGQSLEVLRSVPGSYFEQSFCHTFRLICLRNRGQLAELQAGFSAWLREAERRGDRFTLASLHFNLNNIWLARDEPEEALRDLERASWVHPQGGYHVQHWYEQHARAEIALYRGRGQEGLAHFRQVLSELSGSFILRMCLHRSVAHWLLGKLLLSSRWGVTPRVALARLREVTRLARSLWREDAPYARTYSRLLSAAVLHQRGQVELARRELTSAIAEAERADLPHCEHSARWRLAALTPGSPPPQQSAAWFSQQRIANPERMTEIWAPGFSSQR